MILYGTSWLSNFLSLAYFLSQNGNWLLTASRDHLLKLFDIRNTKEEVQTFRGHKKEASTVAWHPGWISPKYLSKIFIFLLQD